MYSFHSAVDVLYERYSYLEKLLCKEFIFQPNSTKQVGINKLEFICMRREAVLQFPSDFVLKD